MTVLRSKVTKSQRKLILNLMPRQIAPWFSRVELLMDFLTDSFDMGGSTSLITIWSLYSDQREEFGLSQLLQKALLSVGQHLAPLQASLTVPATA